MTEAKHIGGPVDRLDLLGAIIDDERARMIHTKVARHILKRYFQKFGNARASVGYLEQATGLTRGSVAQASSDLVEWGYFTRIMGVGKRPTEYRPVFSVLQPQDTCSVPQPQDERNPCVLQPQDESVLQPQDAKSPSVPQPQDQTLLPNPATARVTVKESSAPGSASGLAAAAPRASVRLTVTSADVQSTEGVSEFRWQASAEGGEQYADRFFLEHHILAEQDHGQKRLAELVRAVGLLEAPDAAESFIGLEFEMVDDDYIPADEWGRRAMGDGSMTNTELFPDRALRGRRLTWQEFYRLRPDRRPVAANDNERPAFAPADSFVLTALRQSK